MAAASAGLSTSLGTGALVTGEQAAAAGRDVDLAADVAIVGSGAAGAVVARELASAGLRVVVLEEGGFYSREFYGRLQPSEAFRHLYRDASLTMAIGTGDTPVVFVQVGRAVGGSTVVNGGVCFRPPARVVKAWKDAGLDFPDDRLHAAIASVERTLRVEVLPERVLGGNARFFRRGADALGLSHGVMARNTPGCRGCCRCIFGCPTDAKQAVHLNYLPQAIAKGALVHADARVDEILVSGGAARGVAGSILDRATGRPRARIRVRADAVVLACGATHTPALLLRQRLANQHGQVGRHLHLHPSSRVLARFDEEVKGWQGALQGTYSQAFESEGIQLNQIFVPPGIMAATLPGFGLKAKTLLADYAHMAAYGVMVSDKSTGSVHALPGSGRPVMTYHLMERDKRLMVRGIKRLSSIWFAAGAREVYPGIVGHETARSMAEVDAIDERRVRGRDLELVSQHPMGSCRLGPDPRASVVGPDFACHGVRGLYVPDASFFPTSVGVNPQITIMTYATLFAWGFLGRRTADVVAEETELARAAGRTLGGPIPRGPIEVAAGRGVFSPDAG